MKRRSLRRRLLFSLIMGGLVLAVTESMAGFATWFLIKPMVVSKGLLAHPNVAPHPYRSYMLRPGQTIWDTGTASGVVAGMELDFGLIPSGVVTNEFGHQVLPHDWDLHTLSKQPNEYRILFLGGSTTFQSWPFFVGESLARRNTAKTVKIINASAGGYTSQENLIDLVVSGFSYQPDMVVAYLPVNDIAYAAHYPGFKRDYTHMRVPLQTHLAGVQPDGVIRRYPFALRLLDTVIYNRRMNEYVEQASLNYFITHQPDPMGTGHTVDPDDFEKTAAAVIDNIFNMKSLCESRGIRFILLTQKMFKVDHPYTSVIHDRTLECISRIAAAPRLRGVMRFDMQALFPDEWDGADRDLVKAAFPNRSIDFNQRLAYDDMHFTPGGLFLFAAIVVEQISPLIE